MIDDFSKADEFNKYFQSVFTIEDISDIDSLQEHLIFNDSIISVIEFTASVVCEYLSKLDTTKACGPDLLPAFLLKHVLKAFLHNWPIYSTNPCLLIPFHIIGYQLMLVTSTSEAINITLVIIFPVNVLLYTVIALYSYDNNFVCISY